LILSIQSLFNNALEKINFLAGEGFLFVKGLVREQNNYKIVSHGTRTVPHDKINPLKYLEILHNGELT